MPGPVSDSYQVPDDHTVFCAFCGQAYPEGTPTSKAKILEEHIRKCPKHPVTKELNWYKEWYKSSRAVSLTRELEELMVRLINCGEIITIGKPTICGNYTVSISVYGNSIIGEGDLWQEALVNALNKVTDSGENK